MKWTFKNFWVIWRKLAISHPSYQKQFIYHPYVGKKKMWITSQTSSWVMCVLFSNVFRINVASGNTKQNKIGRYITSISLLLWPPPHANRAVSGKKLETIICLIAALIKLWSFSTCHHSLLFGSALKLRTNSKKQWDLKSPDHPYAVLREFTW